MHVHAVNGDGAAIGLDHAVNHAQTSGLPQAGGADEHGNLPAGCAGSGSGAPWWVRRFGSGSFGDVFEADSARLRATSGSIFCPGNLR